MPAYHAGNTKRITRQVKIQQLLSALDYNILRIKKKNGEFLGLEELQAFGIHGDLELCEYLLVHQSRVAEVRDLLSLK